MAVWPLDLALEGNRWSQFMSCKLQNQLSVKKQKKEESNNSIRLKPYFQLQLIPPNAPNQTVS